MIYCQNVWKFFVLIVCVIEASLIGGWSSPELIYPSAPPYNALTPFMATDGNGNSVAVWFDITDSGSLQSATLASGSVNSQGQPNWIMTDPIRSSGVEPAELPYEKAVGMSSNGTAMAVWTDGTYVYVATLPLGGTSWSSPTVINSPTVGESTGNLYISVNPNGNAIVTWLSLFNDIGSYKYFLMANMFDANSQSWLGMQDILGENYETSGLSNPAVIDSLGNVVIAMNTSTNDALSVSYNADSSDWTFIPNPNSSSVICSSIAMDAKGDAVILWVEESLLNQLNAATLLLNQSSFTNPELLSSNLSLNESIPQLVMDSSGNAVTAWPDASGNLASARYSVESGVWTILPLLDLGGNSPFEMELSINSSGNVMAVWLAFSDPTSCVVAAALASEGSSWQLLSQLSPSSATDYYPQILITEKNAAIAMWVNGIDWITGTISSSIFLNVFSLPPASFTGRVIQNRFLMQTDRIHQLSWSASLDPSTVEYKLYRNSVLIATISANKNSFTYEDHNRNKNVSDRYTLVTVNATGISGAPLYVTLQ